MLKIYFALLLSLLNSPMMVSAADYPANHCEIYVDKAAAWSSSYGYAGVTFKIKTMPSRIDGAIKQVGFHSIVRSTPKIEAFCKAHPPSNGNSNDCDFVDKWMDRPAQSFFGPDYFRIDFELYHMYTFDHIFEGVFYVETVKGTRYWLAPASGGNFFVDQNLRSNLLSLGSGGYFKQGKDLSTADVFDYVNPSHCR
ncbi:MAG: hypothetical protein SGJ18_02965 [Pseudomonadota bacterium]|nr:hypothetical protein [Pseudomonadota bacterium]